MMNEDGGEYEQQRYRRASELELPQQLLGGDIKDHVRESGAALTRRCKVRRIGNLKKAQRHLLIHGSRNALLTQVNNFVA
jgi:hypothetical protein